MSFRVVITDSFRRPGGARVITCVKIVGETVYLLTIYDKSEQDFISDNERDELLRENGLR